MHREKQICISPTVLVALGLESVLGGKQSLKTCHVFHCVAIIVTFAEVHGAHGIGHGHPWHGPPHHPVAFVPAFHGFTAFCTYLRRCGLSQRRCDALRCNGPMELLPFLALSRDHCSCQPSWASFATRITRVREV